MAMAGADAHAHAGAGAGAAAHAGAHAAVGLRALCASAAASIRDECEHVLRRGLAAADAEGNISRRAEDGCAAGGLVGAEDAGAAAGDRDQGAAAAAAAAMSSATANGTRAGLGLADCGDPLVHLLSRQASRLAALYEAAAPEYHSLMSPIPVGPGRSAADDGQPHATRPPAAGARQLRGDHNDANGGLAHGGGLLLKRLDDIISIAYSKFYAYLYKDLPLCWRQLYTDASILKFGYLFLSSSQQIWGLERDGVDVTVSGQDARDAAEQSTQAMVKTLDLALILAGAGGLSRGRKWIDTAFDLFETACDPTNVGDTMTTASHGSRHGLPAMTAAANITPPPAKRARLDSSARTAAPRRAGRAFSTFEPFTPPVRNAIRRVSADVMDMAAFQQYLDRADPHRGPDPLILTGLIEDWPARGPRPWDNPEYLLSRTFGGRRLVPVEIGRSYVDEGWGQKIVTFGEFLRNHIDPTSVAPHQAAPAPTGQDQKRRRTPEAAEQAGDRSDPPRPSPLSTASSPAEAAAAAAASTTPPQPPTKAATVAYLAQHQLLLQLPQLRNDILIPDHCYTTPPPHPTDPSQDQPELDSPLLNAWLGPPGTITPLHTDPYHNLLAQVAGRKYVRLYSPLEGRGGADGGGGGMRARSREGGVDMGNTSAWDVGVLEGWDADPGLPTPASASAIGGEDDRRGDAAAGAEGSDEEEQEQEQEDQAAAGARLFREVPFVDCILEPGDTLYVPIGWWHYVRGLSVSFSVSLWWNGGEG